MESKVVNEFRKESILQNSSFKDLQCGIRYVKFYDNFACVYKPNCRQVNEKSIETLLAHNKPKRKYNGYMSSATKSKIRKMLDSWVNAIEAYNKKHRNLSAKDQRRLVFCTLTLSSEQINTDKEIKRDLLVPFIQNLIRSFNVKYYFWRAEKQQNGNIHFHLIIDSFIPREELTLQWNYFQNKLGYIDRYTNKTGNINPPSTDIRQLTRTGNIISYVMKYVTKDEDGLLVDGRIWGCSDKLKDLEVFTEVVDSNISSTFSYLITNNLATQFHNEHVSLIYFKDLLSNLLPKCSVLKVIQDYYYKLYKEIYISAPGTDINNVSFENLEPETIGEEKEYCLQLTLDF